MSKGSERLLALIGSIDSEIIAEAEEDAPGKAKKHRVVRFAAAAAVLAAAVGVGLLFIGNGDSVTPSPGNDMAGDSSETPVGGHSEFMDYAGPIFPLTLLSPDGDISAERSVTLDFSPWIRTWWSNEDEANSRENITEERRREILEMYNKSFPEGGRWRSSQDILVTDEYVLKNASSEDKTVTLLYPFAGDFRNLDKVRPSLTLDGAELPSTLLAGGYKSDFEGPWSGPIEGSSEGEIEVLEPESWEDYRKALGDGEYLKGALSGCPDFSGVTATVYDFTDPWGGPKSDAAPNPTIRVDFELDYTKTFIVDHGFNGGRYDSDAGRMGLSYSIPQPGEPETVDPRIIVVGEPIRNITTGGYVTGGHDPDTGRMDAGVTITSHTANLEELLREEAKLLFTPIVGSDSGPEFELAFRLYKLWLVTQGPLAYNGWGRDETLDHTDRVFYLEAEVTIPAGGSVTLTAECIKEESENFYGSGRDANISGYDLVTRLGSNLDFVSQTATLEDRGQIVIARQNFGFDIAGGVKTVELTEDEYFLEVYRLVDTSQEKEKP